MADVKDPYSILGIKPGASKDDIIKRYDLLLKKYKVNKNGKAAGNEQINIEDIEQAYNMLMGYDFESLADGKLSEDANKPPNPILKKMNVDQKKLSNFIFYYKIPIIIGLFAVLGIFLVLKSIFGYVKPDLKIELVGMYSDSNLDKLEERIKDNISGVKKVNIDPIIFWDKKNPAMESSMEIKFATLSGTGDIDLYLLDKERFDKLLKMSNRVGILDDIAKKYEDQKMNLKVYRSKLEDQTTEHIYGINISDSSFIKGTALEGSDVILCFGNNEADKENRMKLVDLLFKR
ncbi:MAG: DnaJ domain-containing protein [Bacillota bacterium]|nr:DnaJ domain-containing protein [Bacillota bacterium]